MLAEGLGILVPAPEHGLAQLVSGAPPRRHRAGEAQLLGEAGGAVQRHLAQPRRVREDPALAADLPDALVGKAPGVHGKVRQAREPGPEVLVEPSASADPLVRAVEHLAVDVVLALVGGAVSPAHRGRAPVALQLAVDALVWHRAAF